MALINPTSTPDNRAIVPGTVLNGAITAPTLLARDDPAATRKDKKAESRLVTKIQNKMQIPQDKAWMMIEQYGHKHAFEMATAVAARNAVLIKHGIDPRTKAVLLPATPSMPIKDLNGFGVSIDRSQIPFKCDLLPLPREYMRDANEKNADAIDATFILAPIMPMYVVTGQLLMLLLPETHPPVWCSFVYLRHLMQMWYVWMSDAEALEPGTRNRLQTEHMARLQRLSDWWDRESKHLLEASQLSRAQHGYAPDVVADIHLRYLEASMMSFQRDFIRSWERSVIEFYRPENIADPEMKKTAITDEYLGCLTIRDITSQQNPLIPDAQRKDIADNTEWVFLTRDRFYGCDSSGRTTYIKLSEDPTGECHTTTLENLRRFWFHVFETPNPSQAPPVVETVTRYDLAIAAGDAPAAAAAISTDLIKIVDEDQPPPLIPMLDLSVLTEGDVMEDD